MSEIHPSIYDIAPSVAGVVHKRFNQWVEREDVLQECYSWAISRTGWIKNELDVEDTKQRIHNEKRVAWQMLRNAERYCRKEKATKSGYNITDEAYYESATLGQLLPFVIASVVDGTVLEQAQEMIRDGQPKGSSSPSEGGNLLAALLDIKKCFIKLEEYDKKLLTYRYYDNYTLAQVAQVLECATSTADRRVSNSMRKLQDLLGGVSPYR
jgi:RNA polymerase sigma factor (sigma-70 family)